MNCILGIQVLAIIKENQNQPQSEDVLRRTTQPAKSVVEAFCSSATVLIREERYFDLDYRSEFSKTQELTFQVRTLETARLHFFNADTPPAQGDSMRDFIQRNVDNYLGYVVSRPHAPGAIGRSIVTPSGICTELAHPSDLHNYIRTAVAEHVQLFGVSLTATGVAFMEQDRHLLRCAHVSAWICHYSAVLRGLVSRQPTAAFHGAGDIPEPYGRAYPSVGLSTSALSIILREMQLPPEVVDRRILQRIRKLIWADSKELQQEMKVLEAERIAAEKQRQEAVEQGKDVLDHSKNLTNINSRIRQLWTKQNLTATVCRYLNSGVPCILTRRVKEHTQVIVGYLRDDAMAQGAAEEGSSTHSAVNHFIVSDDRKGPYVVLPVGELVDEVLARNSATSVVIPLPRALLLSGDIAEASAATVLATLAKRRLARLEEWHERESRSYQLDEHRAALSAFVQGSDGLGDGSLTIRSYVTLGADFKESVAARAVSEEMNHLVRTIGFMQLPKYVWVSESISRELRRTRVPDVVAMVVMDASDPTGEAPEEPIISQSSYPLFIHIPGQARAKPRFEELVTTDTTEDSRWFEAGLAPYTTGRYSHDQTQFESSKRFAARFKTAGAPF